MNSITLISRLTAEPELQYFPSGTNVAKSSIAVNRPPRNGEKVADFFNCEAWGKTADLVSNYCTKGKQIGLLGKIEFEHWSDFTTGEKRSKPVVKVERIELLGNSNSGADSQHSSKVVATPSGSEDDCPVF